MPNKDSDNPFLNKANQTLFKKAKAWDGILAKDDMRASISMPVDSVFSKANAFTNLDYNRISFNGNTQINGTNDEAETHQRIASCREAYENVGIIGNIIDIMVDFALEDLEIQHNDEKIKQFFKKWMKTAKTYEVSEQILKGVYRDGNVPILSFFGELNEEEINRMRKSSAEEKKFVSSRILDPEIPVKNVIPFRYEMLDVLRVFRTGSELLDTVGWSYRFSPEDLGLKSVNTSTQIGEDRDKAIDNFEKQIGIGTDTFDKLKSTGFINLPKNRLKMLYYKRDGYRSWATPLLWRVIPDVKFKKLIRNMDISVAEGVTNALTIVKLGSTEKGFLPSKKKYQKLTSMLMNPHKSKTIVWDDLISIETVFPPVENFFSAEKYKQVDADIRAGLGIPEALINGEGGNFSNSFLAIKTLMERLETGQKILESFWVEQVNIVSRNMRFRKSPIVRIGKMSLTDEEVEKRFMIELFDRNVISFETLLDRFGEDIGIEVERIRREDAKRKVLEQESDHALLRIGKFTSNIAQLLNDDDIDGNDPAQQGGEGEKGGRPPGTKKKQQQQTQPDSPQGQKTAAKKTPIPRDRIDNGFDKLYKMIATTIADNAKYDSLRDLTEADRINIIDNIGKALPQLVCENRWTKDLVKNALKSKSGKKLDRCVESVTKEEVAKFRKKHDKAPNKKAMRAIVQKAFSICNASISED